MSETASSRAQPRRQCDLFIASKAASPTYPDWYHNVVANPEAIIEIGAEKFPVRAKVAEGEERERLFNATH